jgi:hypothetical protein
VCQYGPTFLADYAYLIDGISGAGMDTILAGHTLDLAISILGEIQQVGVLNTIMFEDVELYDPPSRVKK